MAGKRTIKSLVQLGSGGGGVEPTSLAAFAREIGLEEELLDDPDCLAEMEFTYSVFRFRYSWGTVFELTFTNHADAHDRKVCFRLMPAAHVFLETVESATMGLGANGIVREVTHRFVTAN